MLCLLQQTDLVDVTERLEVEPAGREHDTAGVCDQRRDPVSTDFHDDRLIDVLQPATNRAVRGYMFSTFC